MAFNFNGVDKRIEVLSPTVTFDVLTLYRDWKLWIKQVDNSKYPLALLPVGGNALSGGKSISSYVELINGWKIYAYVGSYTLNIVGNVFTADGIVLVIPAGSNVLAIVESTANSLTVTSEIGYVADVTPPTWVTDQGVISLEQIGDSISAIWGIANDAVSTTSYKVYISSDVTTLWSSLLCETRDTRLKIFTESDGVTILGGVEYFVGIRAVDEDGNETTNTNNLPITFVSGGVTTGLTAQAVWEYTTGTTQLSASGITDKQQAELVKLTNTVIAVS